MTPIQLLQIGTYHVIIEISCCDIAGVGMIELRFKERGMLGAGLGLFHNPIQVHKRARSFPVFLLITCRKGLAIFSSMIHSSAPAPGEGIFL